MDKEFIPYKEALILKELGFDEICFAWYVSSSYGLEIGIIKKNDLIRDAVLAPTYSQVFRWFREKYDLKFYIRQDIWNHWCSIKMILKGGEYNGLGDYETYEEAELACLKKLIETVKENKK